MLAWWAATTLLVREVLNKVGAAGRSFWLAGRFAALRFACETRGNVLVIFTLALLPMLLVIGLGMDYGLAAYRQEQLNALADAAALAGVTPAMMLQSDSASITAASNMFNGQATSVAGIDYSSSNLNVTVTDNNTQRTVTVSYTASSQNIFGNLVGLTTTALSGSAQASNTASPNIDFYLLLDDSPSMALAATQADQTTLQNNTRAQTAGGCAFACHESAKPPLSTDVRGNPVGSDGYTEDNYTLARKLGVTLRIDLMKSATQNFLSTAQQMEAANGAQYRAALSTFDSSLTTIQALTSNLASASNEVNAINVLEVYQSHYLTSSNQNMDEDTDYDNAMNTMNGNMPAPGNGTHNPADTPQEVLFIVTDGVTDEAQASPLNPTTYPGMANREQYYMNAHQDWCTAIKNRGIRIAIIYTVYLPLPNFAWYVNFSGTGKGISPFQSSIGSQLQTCASPGLYAEVQVASDTAHDRLSAMMTQLFETAIQTARLTQ